MNANMSNVPPHITSILSKYGVFSPNLVEVHYQPYYSYLTYPVTGAASFSFFTVGSTPSTRHLTNLPGNGGALPKPVNFLMLGAEVVFKSGASPTGAIVSGKTSADDYAAIIDAPVAYFELNLGQKPYLIESPLSVLPEITHPNYTLALADTVAAAVGTANPAKERRGITPILIQSQEQFLVSITFPGGALAPPSGLAGTIGVRLNGYQYSLAQ